VGSFGDKLKRERELRGVTLEEISKATKIGTRALKALEDEHFNQLPGGIFNKGFVRAYAKFLGLDEEQMVADFVAAQGDQQKPDLMASLAVKAEAQRRSEIAASGGEKGGSTSTWVTLAILVLLTAGAAAGVRYYKMRKEAAANRVRVEAQAPQSIASVTTPSDASLNVGPMNSATADPNAAQPGASTAGTAAPTTGGSLPTTNAAGAPGSTATASQTGATPSNSATTPAPATTSAGGATAKGPLELQIHVSKATWVSVQADGNPATTETLRDSATKTVVAQGKVVLTTGNSVDVTCNGKPLGILGTDNQRSQVKITADCKVN